MPRSITDKAYLADVNSADVDTLADLVDAWAKANPELTDRRIIPLGDEHDALAQHRIRSNNIGSAVQWVQAGPDKRPSLRIMGTGTDGELKVGAPLGSRHNLASFAPRDRNTGEFPIRKQFAVDLNRLIPGFYDMETPKVIERAKDKYAYINHRGYEAHHMLPIGFMGRIKSELENLGIQGPVVDELILRKMYQGDTPGNLSLAHMSPKVDRNAKGIQGLKPLEQAPYNEHKMIHDTGENFLKDVEIYDKLGNVNEIIDLADVYAVSDDQPRAVNENDITDLMRSDASTLRKQAIAMAVPQAHRLGMQEIKLGPADAESASDARKVRYLKEKTMLDADVMKATTDFKPYTQRLLSRMYGTKVKR